MKPSSGARALNWACGATGIVLVAAGLVAALITGFIAFILTAEGFHFFAGLAWFVTVMCVLAPFLFLCVYDEWQKKQGIHEQTGRAFLEGGRSRAAETGTPTAELSSWSQ